METTGFCAPLSGRRRADAAIVGGGLTGLMLGEMLTRSGLRVELIEGGRIGSGASGLCSGTVTLQQYDALRRIMEIHGSGLALDYASLLRHELGRLPRLWGKLSSWLDTACYTYAFLPRDLPALEVHQKLYDALQISCRQAPDAGGCPFPVELSLMTEHQQTVDVPALLTGLTERIRAQGGHIHEHTQMLHMAQRQVYAANAVIEAPFIALCTGMPLGLADRRLLGLLEVHTLIGSRLASQVPLHTCQQSVRPDGLSLRPANGGAYAAWDLGRVGSRDMEQRAALHRRVLAGRLPEWEITDIQMRQEVWSMDGLPIAGPLPDAAGILCATGYSGWGILGAAMASGVMARHILGRREPQDQLFRPDRRLPGDTQRKLAGRLSSIRRKSRRRLLSPRCPHMGCRLRYSHAAEQWGCPYCGSVFSMLGQRISGPSLHPADVSPLRRPLK